jgi:hypothetical protein
MQKDLWGIQDRKYRELQRGYKEILRRYRKIRGR